MLTFVSQAALDKKIPEQIGLKKPAIAVIWDSSTEHKRHEAQRCNAYEVDPETNKVRAEGKLLTYTPATVLPLAQRYFLF